VRFLRIPREKVRVVQNGVDDRFRRMPDKAECRKRVGYEFPFVLFVGNLVAKRNVHRLVRGFARVSRQHPEMKLVLAGPYDPGETYVRELRRIIEREGLGQKTLLPGYIDDEELPALYNAAEAFAYVPFYEGFCLPPLEAMACGVPVVVSDNPPLREVVGDAAIIVDPLRVDDIARGMEVALFDDDMRGRLREKGVARAALFPWGKTARGVLAVYEEALGGSHPGRL
jgi:glycosyltransferase involved in cell wall biosynthesis